MKKDFDLAAAKRGATVCTREGKPAKFDGIIEGYGGNTYVKADVVVQMTFFNDGRNFRSTECDFDLVMADDDYLEKLERGEYDHIEDNLGMAGKPDHIDKSTEKVDWEYWRKLYAGMAMQGFCRESTSMNPASIIASLSVEYANVLIEELKKTQK